MTPHELREAHQELIKAIRKGETTHVAFWIYQGARPERNNWEALKVAYQKNSEPSLCLCLKNSHQTPPDQLLLSLLETHPETTDANLIDRITRLIKDPRSISLFLKEQQETPKKLAPNTLRFLQLQYELLNALQTRTNPLAL